jgi:hypothetical protein
MNSKVQSGLDMLKSNRMFPKLVLAGVLAFGYGLETKAATLLVQIVDDASDHVWIDTYEDGTLIQHFGPFSDSYKNAGYVLWNNATLTSNVNVAYNIFDPGGALSDTWQISGTAGHTLLVQSFISDSASPSAIPGALSITETGAFQTLLSFTASNGDSYTWQILSEELAAPIPGAIWLFGTVIAGVAGIGSWRKGRKNAAGATAL